MSLAVEIFRGIVLPLLITAGVLALVFVVDSVVVGVLKRLGVRLPGPCDE